jgi:hypothetical protein
MPISYTIDRERRFVLSTWSGEITAEMYLAHMRRLFSDDEAVALGRSMADMRTATLSFTAAELKSLSQSTFPAHFAQQPWIVAIVVSTPAEYGVMRQLQARSIGRSKNALFRDYNEALRWLLDTEPK